MLPLVGGFAGVFLEEQQHRNCLLITFEPSKLKG
jgi:hypothetical protein